MVALPQESGKRRWGRMIMAVLQCDDRGRSLMMASQSSVAIHGANMMMERLENALV